MADVHILALDATRQGGAGVYTARFAKELALRGHRVTLICHEATSELKNLITVHELPRPVSRRPYGMWRFSSFLQLGSYRRLLKGLPLSTPDAVFGSAQPMVWSYFKLYPKRPLVYLPHSLVAPIELLSYGYANKLQKKIAVATYHYLERWCLQRARCTVRFSQTACNAFRAHYGDRVCRNLTVIPMPINIPSQALPTVQSKELRLLSVGRLIKSKNLMFLLETLSTFRKLHWHLDLVGSGDERSSLESYAEQTGIANRISFHGHSDDVEPFYRQADLFVFPSVLENLPLVLLEAMSYSLPTLSFRPDGITIVTATDELISHGQNGLLADNPSIFVDLLRKILEGDLLTESIGSEAAKTIENHHRWEVHMKKIEDVILSSKAHAA